MELLASDENHDVWNLSILASCVDLLEKMTYECTNNKTPVDRNIGEHHKPSISRASLGFSRCLSSSNTSSRVLSSDANTEEETIGSQSSEETT